MRPMWCKKNDNEEFWDFCEKAHGMNPVEYFDLLRHTYGDTPHWTAQIYRHSWQCAF